MHERYQDNEIRDIWSRHTTLTLWCMVEAAMIRARIKVGHFPTEAHGAAAFIENIGPSLDAEMTEVEKRTHHDVAAFLTVISNHLGGSGKYLHLGMTSSDVVDTAQWAQMNASVRLINTSIGKLNKLYETTGYTECRNQAIGYTHGRPGDLIRAGNRWRRFPVPELRFTGYPHLSGAMGDFKLSNLPVATIALDNINYALRCRGWITEPLVGLKTDYMQCADRLDIARTVGDAAITATALEKAATDLRLLIFKGEVTRQPSKDEVGSSAMPHKVNPVDLEKVCGLARMIRSYVSLSMENSLLWLERDISHSSVERSMLPDMFHALRHILTTMSYAAMSYQTDVTVVNRTVAELYGQLSSAEDLYKLQMEGVPWHEAHAKLKAQKRTT